LTNECNIGKKEIHTELSEKFLENAHVENQKIDGRLMLIEVGCKGGCG
jgi:hypothetical protein